MYIAIIYQKDSKTGDLHEIEHRRFITGVTRKTGRVTI